MTVMEFHGESVEIQKIFVVQWTYSKHFLVSWAIIWFRASEVGKYGNSFYDHFWVKKKKKNSGLISNLKTKLRLNIESDI